MKNNNLEIINFFHQVTVKNNTKKNFFRKFSVLMSNLRKDLNSYNKTLNVLNKKFIFDHRIKQLKKFKNYKKIAIIGMGGSILGAEAIYIFFKRKLKKNFTFLMI